MTTERLYKSSTDRMITGVSGGLAEYFSVDPALVRVAFIVLTLASSGLGLLAYIVLAILLPDERTIRPVPGAGEDAAADPEAAPVGQAVRGGTDPEVTARRRNAVAVILIIVGTLFLLGNLGLVWWLGWQTLWPLVLIAIGAFLILAHVRRT